MGSDYRQAQNQFDFVKSVGRSTFDEIARSMGILVTQVAIVASYNTETKETTVYFPSDLTTESSPYYNLTGQDLTVGQKVYIFYKYGDIEQGWIMAI